MGEFGYKILNYQAGSVYAVSLGVRNNYDCTPAMLTNSLFLDFLIENGLNIHKNSSTRDIIGIEFAYGTRSATDCNRGQLLTERMFANACLLFIKLFCD